MLDAHHTLFQRPTNVVGMVDMDRDVRVPCRGFLHGGPDFRVGILRGEERALLRRNTAADHDLDLGGTVGKVAR